MGGAEDASRMGGAFGANLNLLNEGALATEIHDQGWRKTACQAAPQHQRCGAEHAARSAG